ncbi:MAG: hypothetical protein GY866_08320 [Proteobacteria bacterium]|nr:hypothetical protein [Pseudomonadota bacterium]
MSTELRKPSTAALSMSNGNALANRTELSNTTGSGDGECGFAWNCEFVKGGWIALARTP